MEIQRAQPDQLEDMCQITDQAKTRLKDMGVNQWQTGYPSRDIWKEDIAKGRAFVAVDESGKLLGQFVYIEEADPSYGEIEGSWLTDDPYACIHRVAVADEARGQGVAQRMFEHAFGMARAKGLSSIRIDTHEENAPMQRALGKAGFEQRGVIHLKEGLEIGAPRIAFERLL